MQTYNEFKIRAATVYPYNFEMKRTQVTAMCSIQICGTFFINRINVDTFFKLLLNCPEMMANTPNLRVEISFQITRILASYLGPVVNEDIRLAISDYIGWLKRRSDYVMTDEEKAKAMLKVPIREAVFFPDRCDRMLATYGDPWVDVHFD